MQDIIEDEIEVDCYDQEEANMGWYYFMAESMSFPFMAKTTIKKRGGATEETTVEVVGNATDAERFGGDDFYVNVDYKGVLMKVEVRDLEPIDASEKTGRALAVWRYGKGGMNYAIASSSRFKVVFGFGQYAVDKGKYSFGILSKGSK